MPSQYGRAYWKWERTMFNRPLAAFNWLKIQFNLPLIRHVAIVLVLLLAAQLIFTASISFSDARTMSALSEIIPGGRKAACVGGARNTALAPPGEKTPDVTTIVNSLLPNLSGYPASQAEKQRIADQALKAQRLECLHAAFVSLYARNYYGSVVVSMVFGGVAAIALFFVSSKGWSA